MLWLAGFDPSAENGRGRVMLTSKREEAVEFPSFESAMRAYQASPACHPTRESDGKPNRPLTAYHVEIIRTDVAPL